MKATKRPVAPALREGPARRLAIFLFIAIATVTQTRKRSPTTRKAERSGRKAAVFTDQAKHRVVVSSNNLQHGQAPGFLYGVGSIALSLLPSRLGRFLLSILICAHQFLSKRGSRNRDSVSSPNCDPGFRRNPSAVLTAVKTGHKALCIRASWRQLHYHQGCPVILGRAAGSHVLICRQLQM